MSLLLLAMAVHLPELPPPPKPTDHDAKCVVQDVAGKSHSVELKLTFVGRSEAGNPRHRWTILGDPNVFPSGNSDEMTTEEEPRYTFSEIGVSPVSFPERSTNGSSMMASDQTLPRSSAQAFGEKAFKLKYRLDFDMEPEIYSVRRQDRGFLRVYAVNDDMGLEARSIGFCDITSHPAAQK